MGQNGFRLFQPIDSKAGKTALLQSTRTVALPESQWVYTECVYLSSGRRDRLRIPLFCAALNEICD